MSHHRTIKNHQQEIYLFKVRSYASLTFVLIFIAVLSFRLFHLQIEQHHFYYTLSRNNTLNVIPIEPNRGLIYDRNGVLLAENIPTFRLAITPKQVKNLNLTFDKLKLILPITDDDIKQFNRLRIQYRAFQPIPFKFKLTESEVARFYVNQYRFPGVTIQATMTRQYPLNSEMSTPLGYIGRINQSELQDLDPVNYSASTHIGKVGIEKSYEAQLHGIVGSEEAEIDASGHIVRILKRTPPISGQNLYLTLDSRIQSLANETLGDKQGAIIVINPQNGDILALVSKPNYDPNLFVRGLTSSEYHALLNSPGHPLYNRTVHGQFAPGSTVKPFFSLLGLNDGLITSQFRIFDPGKFQLPNTSRIYHDWKRPGHGWVNLERAIIVSCDIYFYNLAANMGIIRMGQLLSSFGFGRKTGIDLPGELSGIVPSPKWKMANQGYGWYPGNTIETGIGQGFLLVTPIQLAQAVTIIANRGFLIQPHLLLNSKSSKKTQVVILKDPKIWETVIHAMTGVIDHPEGTASHFGKHSGYSVAAKTGTAQVFGHRDEEEVDDEDLPKQLRSNHLFIAFAPIDQPQIAIAIVVEHDANADKMAADIFNFYFHGFKRDTILKPFDMQKFLHHLFGI